MDSLDDLIAVLEASQRAWLDDMAPVLDELGRENAELAALFADEPWFGLD